MIIGVLVCLNLFFETLAVVSIYSKIYGYFIPDIIFTSITAANFIRMANSLGTSHDKKARDAFSASYTSLFLIASSVWQFIKPMTHSFASDFCSVAYNQQAFNGQFNGMDCSQYIK